MEDYCRLQSRLPEMIELDAYLSNAESVLMELMNEWRPKLLKSFGVAKFNLKADRSVVTDLDKSLETAIKEVLRPLSEEVGFVGEEHGQEGPSDIFWFVDPIDGTEQFIRGLDGCRTLLTFIKDNEPIYAFAYRFTTGDLFTAQKDKGTRKNGKLINVLSRPANRAWVEMAVDLQIQGNAEKMAAVSLAVNCVVYTKEFLNVIEGSIDAYVVIGGKGKMWDYAPRALMMREAGLKITNIGSKNYDYKNLSLIAASPEMYDVLSPLLSPQA